MWLLEKMLEMHRWVTQALSSGPVAPGGQEAGHGHWASSHSTWPSLKISPRGKKTRLVQGRRPMWAPVWVLAILIPLLLPDNASRKAVDIDPGPLAPEPVYKNTIRDSHAAGRNPTVGAVT